MGSFFIILAFIIFISLSIIVNIITFNKRKNNSLEKKTYLNIISKTAAKMGLKSNGTNIYGTYKDKLFSINYLGFDEEIILLTFEVLQQINNINAVEFILPFTKGKHSDMIKKKAIDTINYLQKNINDSDKGNLAIIETDIGNLSISEKNNKGNLSLEKKIN